MRLFATLLVSLLAVSVAACGDGPAVPDVPTLNGRFVGSTAGAEVDLSLSEAAGAVSGSGTISIPDPPGSPARRTIPVTITGTHHHPEVSLIARADGQPDAAFAGTFTNENTVSGTLTVPGFPTVSLALMRR